jgi:hypothetical protein
MIMSLRYSCPTAVSTYQLYFLGRPSKPELDNVKRSRGGLHNRWLAQAGLCRRSGAGLLLLHQQQPLIG